MIMQFIEGNGLHDVIAEHAPLSIGWVASVLDAAHSQGILHRDLKPSNLMLCRDGSIRVLDFGLAFLHDATLTTLTMSGQQLGTAAYMSPEQIEAQPASGRTDVYSLGCVLYEAATSRPLFTGANDHNIKTQHVTSPAEPAGQYRADIPRGLDELLLAMVEKDPANRPKDMREVYERLMPYLSGPGPLGDMTAESPSPLMLYSRALSRTTVVGQPAPKVSAPATLRDDFSEGDIRRARRDARSLIRDSRYGEAVSLLKEALTHAPSVQGLREQLAEAYLAAEDYEQAAFEYRQLAKSSEPSQAFHHRLQEAICQAHLGDLDLALHLMTALLADTSGEDDPRALELRRQIGELERDAGRLDQARLTLSKLLSDLRRVYGEEHAATERVRQLLGAI
ncbi:protein kinase [Nonomuraea sp. NPDC059007]|uniref:protein kinase domain-containing protein n=1 Tax=Nonomuraea sp. NPDC059007 TaxID=3346692 RepID=UPI0036C06AB2